MTEEDSRSSDIGERGGFRRSFAHGAVSSVNGRIIAR